MDNFDDMPMDKDEIRFDGSFLIRTSKVGKCWHCNKDTLWLHGGFETHLCSPACLRAKWDEFIEACSQLTGE
jgi:hypothetical protein